MWVGDINFVTPQRNTTYNLQSQISSNTFLFARDLSLKNNKSVDSILTNVQKKIDDTDIALAELSGNVKTVQAKDIEQDKRIDTIESYAKESLGNLEELSGSVVNNYYTKTEVDGKIPTSTSQLTNDSGYLTEHQSLEEYYTKAQTYSKSEIDSKIGDINNILESI